MASITVDVEARVKGYQEAIEKMRAEFAKLDPGSAMGKSISKALQSADAQVKNLSKNMFPKASSDNQIDAIIEKVNHAGESIREVARLMQQVGAQDLNLGALGGGITDFKNQITALQNEIETKLSQGILNAVNSSEQLKSVFTDILGIDLSKASASDLFAALEKGALRAANAVEQAEAAVNKAQNELNQSKTKVTNLENGLLGTAGSKQQLQDEVRQLENDYNIAITDLRDRVSKGLQKVFSEGKIDDPQKLLDSFFTGLTPDNLKQKIEDLFNQLSLNDTYKNKGDFYKDFFGDFKNINQVLKDIDLSALTTVTEKFKTLVDTVSEKIGSGEAGNIKQLLDNGMLMTAAEQTVKDIEQAYKKVHQAIDREYAKIKDKLTPALNQALEQQQIAQTQQGVIQKADTNLQNELTQLKTKVEQQENTIKELNQKIEQITKENIEKVRSGGRTAGAQAGQNMFPTQAANEYSRALDQVKAKEQMVGKIQGVVQRWFSIYAAVRMVSNAIKAVISTVKELDKTITEIAIVTNMTQNDLWGQMDKYTETARKYATSISGVYKVSQLYYQQGLQQADVMALTEQTLKMARISGLEYATATDYMTNAVRSFKMEMTDASTVVDVYSAIAASSATSVTELASAMSKTASSAQAVGSSFQNTTAMMAVMIEATRESAENIGSAMKSIISRYGELTSDPSKTVDSEGEEMSLNRVDKALKTVGITLQDTTGQFRNFDDVIMELAEKWDTIDKNTQRYIATIMAGNRQQSRFLALVSSYDRLKELSETAADSEDASQLQFLKTLDSVDAKTQQLQTSLQSLYVGAGVEKSFRTILDIANAIVKTLDNLGQKGGLGLVIGKIAGSFTNTALLVTNSFNLIKQRFANMQQQMVAQAKVAAAQKAFEEEKAKNSIIWTFNEEKQAWEGTVNEEVIAAQRASKEKLDIAKNEAENIKALNKQIYKQQRPQRLAMVASALGGAATTIAASMDVNEQRGLKAGLTGVGAALQGIGTGFMVGGVAGGIIGTLSALPGIIEALGMASESTEEKISRLSSAIESTNNAQLKSKDALKTLKDYEKKYNELSLAQYDSKEAQQEYLNLQNEIAAQYPELIDYIDEEGNKIIRLGDLYKELVGIKSESYKQDAIEARKTKIKAMSDFDYRAESLGIKNPFDDNDYWDAVGKAFGIGTDKYNKTVLGTAAKAGYDFIPKSAEIYGISDNEIAKKVYGTNVSFNNKELMLKAFQNNLSNNPQEDYGISNFMWELIKSQETGYEMIGKFIDELMVSDKNFGYDDINTILNQLLKGITTVKLNSEIYRYASQIAKNKELIRQGGHKEAEIQTKAMFQDLIEQNPEKITSGLGRAFSQEQFLKSYNDYYAKERASGKTEDVIWEEFAQSQEKYFEDAQQQYNIALNKMQTKNDRNNLEKIFENITDYAPTEFEKVISNINFGKDNQEFYDYIVNYYNSIITSAQESFINGFENSKIKNDIDFTTNEEWISKNFGPKYLSAILSQYQNIFGSSLDNTTKKQQVSLLDSLYTSINAIPDQSIRSKAIQQVSTADLTSLEGIYNLFSSLNNIGVDISNAFPGQAASIKGILVQLSKTLQINLVTSFENFSQDIINQSQDFEKALSSASKGMDLKSASEMATKLGVTLKDFTFKDGKYFYDIAEAPEKIKQAYFKYNEELKQRLDEEYEVFAGNSDIGKLGLLQKTYGGQVDRGILDVIKDDIDDINSFDKEDRENYWKNLGLEVQQGEKLLELYNQYYSSWDKKGSFNKYVLTQLTESHDNMTAAINQYGAYQINAILLQNGYITEFLDNIFKEDSDAKTKAEAAIKSGNIEDLASLGLSDFISIIINGRKDAAANIYKKINESISKGSSSYISEADTSLWSKDTLFNLTSAGILSIVTDQDNKFLGYQANINKDNIEEYVKQIYADKNLSNEEKLSQAKSAWDQVYNKTSTLDNLEKLASSTSLTGEEALSFVDSLGRGTENLSTVMLEYGYQFNEETEKWEQMPDAVEKLQQKLNEAITDGSSIEKINAIQAELDKAKNKQQSDRRAAIKDITSNYKELTEENIEKLATAFNLNYDLVKAAIDSNGDGTYRINITKLKALLNYDELGEADKANIDAMIVAIHDDYLNAITNASSLVSKGTTKQADMENFVKEYNKLFETQKNIGDLFNYSEILESWTLNPEVLKEYVAKQAEELEKNGLLKPGDVDKWIKTQTSQALAGNVNISEFLSSDNTDKNSKAYKKIAEAMRQYYENLFGDTKTPKEIIKQIESNIQDIKSGGTKAVEQVKTWAANNGREATSQEIEEAFNFAINELNDAMGQLADLTVGQITTGKLREYLQAKGKVDADGVVKSVDDMVSVYKAIYDDMKHTAGKTTAGLNAAYAKVKTAEEQGDIDAIAAMGDAMGMTYDTLGQLLGKYDEDLETWMGNNEDLYTKIGNGKIRITDFDSFLQSVPGLRDIDKNSEEYLSAFNAYNDSLVALNRQTEKNILEEVQNVMSAKGGDQINLTYLSSKLGEAAELVLSGTLQQYGASLTDGILTIEEGANLVAITQEIISTATEAADLLPEEIADLKDAISEALQTFIDSIGNGISGKLTERGKLDLQTMAKNYLGIDADQLTFTQTTEGLKLSQKSAILLYQELKKIDDLQARLVFKDLNESLQENNEHYKNVSDIMNRIKYLQDEIAKADGTVSDARRQEYEAELAVAKEILAVRSTSEDSSFDFMSNKIPGGQNNPLNYYNSWQKAIKTIQEGMKVTKGKTKGFIDYQDFYNIATEMNNLAKISGQKFELAGVTLDGSMEAASELIQQGAAALQSVDTGDLKVNLKSVGLDILGGANSLSEGVDAGIHAMAQSQIDMLDGLISLLETIVAMEDLGDVAAETGNKIEIELPDIRILGGGVNENGKPVTNPNEYGFTKAFYDWRKAKLAEIEEGKTGFAKAAKDVKIAGKSLADIIAQKAGEWTNEQAKILNSLWKAAKNGDWDVDNVAESMKKVLADAGLGDDANLTIDVGDTHYIVQGGAVVESINFKSAGAKKSLDKLTRKGGKFAGDVEKAKKYIIDQVDTFNKGGKSKVPLDYTLIAEATGVLKYDKNTGKSYVMFNGEKFEGKDIATALRGRKLAKELGKSFKDITIDKDKGTASAKVTVKGEQELTFDVTMGKNNKATWSTKYNNKTYTGNSKLDVLKKIYNAVTKKSGNERVVTEGAHKGETLTFEQWANLEYNIKVKASGKFYNGSNKEVDVTKNAKLQQAIKDFLKKTNDDITSLVTDNKNGTSTIKIGGYTMEVDTDSIQMGGKTNAGLVRKKLMEALGLDTLLVESITQGIEGALPSISDALGKIGSDAKATAGLKKVADSVKTLADSFTDLKKINLVNLKKNLSQFFKNLAETSKQTGKNPLSIDELTAGLDNLIISSIGDISLAEVEEGSEESSSLVLPQLTADLISLIISSIADISLDEVEEGEDSNVSSIDELKAALTTLLISSVSGAELNDEGLATLTNKDLGTISPTGIVAVLNSLGIKTVDQLAQAAGMTITNSTLSGDITADNIQGVLTQLGITSVGQLAQAVGMTIPETNWENLAANVTATLNSLGITDPGTIALTAAALEVITGTTLPIEQILQATASGVELTNSTATTKQDQTWSVTGIGEIFTVADKITLKNTIASLEEGKTLELTKVDAVTGTTTTITITAADNKILEPTTEYKVNGDVEANVSNAKVKASEYDLVITETDLEGNVISVASIKVPADVMFGDSATLEAYLKTQSGSVDVQTVLSDIQALIDANGPYEAEITAKYGADGGGLTYADYKEKFEEYLNTGKGNFSLDTNGIYTDLDSGYQWTVDVDGQITQYLPPEEEPEPVNLEGEIQPTDLSLEGAESLITSFQQQLEDNDFSIAPTLDTTGINLESLQTAFQTIMDAEGNNVKVPVVADTAEFQEFYNTYFASNEEEEISIGFNYNENEATKIAENIDNTIPSEMITTASVDNNAQSGVLDTLSTLNQLPSSKTIIANIMPRVSSVGATGNVSLATGNAMSQGTLMGELGPELVVSKGRYFVVGQNGAEFVNLDKDAIVFNHLQTEQLLKNGKASRGSAYTNDRNAVGMAAGNVNGGPAMASASAALAALKQLRAMWQSMLDASVQDMAGKGGGGGGGGGGGDKKADTSAWLAQVEKWYNWLQKIAQLEKEINYQEALRNKISSDYNANGKAYVKSLTETLKVNKEEEKYQASIADSQQAYFNKRVKQLNKSAFSKFYTFDPKTGQLQYNTKSTFKDTKGNKIKGGYAALSELMATNSKGGAKYTAKQQYDMIKKWGFGSSMLYDENGKKIEVDKDNMDEFYRNSVQAFWDKMEADKSEMQELRDSIDEANQKVLELEQQRNELLKEMRDNQLDVEQKVYDAIVEREQKKIDDKQAVRDALEKTNTKFLNGLNKSLEKERKMYDTNESKNELGTLKRQLAILQRSGGSASQIASLQKDIRSKEKDQYFDERQAQIDAVQEASDKQLERLDRQIELMTLTLEYSKEHGLLWKEVKQIMAGKADDILKFITNNSKDLKETSTLNQEVERKNLLFQLEKYTEWRDTSEKKLKQNETAQKWAVAKGAIKESAKYSDVFKTGFKYKNSKGKTVTGKEVEEKAQKKFNKVYEETGDENKAREAANKIYASAQDAYDKEHKQGKYAPKKTNNDGNKGNNGDNKGNNDGNKGTKNNSSAQVGLHETIEGKNKKFVKWVSVKAGGGAPSAPSKSGYKATLTQNSIPKTGAIGGKTYSVTYNYTKSQETDWSKKSGGWKVTYKENGDPKEVKYSYKNNKANAEVNANRYANSLKGKKGITNIGVHSYKQGGLVNYTGLAKVDGTPSRPEAFLNAEQTAILKKGLLSGKNSLVSILADFQAMIDSTSHNISNIGEPSIVIENATVEMNVQKMNNDYDARRAGEQALEEMLKIARKTGTRGVSRR